MRDLQREDVDGSHEGLCNKTGHAALSLSVGGLIFSCEDAASPSTHSCDRGEQEGEWGGEY